MTGELPSVHVARDLSLTLGAARRQALADSAETTADRDQHDIAAAMLRMSAERALGLIEGDEDG